MTLTDLPVPFVPSIPLMGAGLILVPVLCLVVLLLIGRRYLTTSPRPYSIIAFFVAAVAAMIVSLGGHTWAYSLQVLIVMTVAALAVVVEVVVRGLQPHRATAGGAVAITAGYYFFLVSVVASASV